MSQLVQLEGRRGWYLRVSVPRELRSIMKTSAIRKKAGDTKEEAIKNRLGLLIQIENLFREKRGEDPIGALVKRMDINDDQFMDVLDIELRQAGIEGGIDAVHTDKDLETRLEAAQRGVESYQEWLAQRILEESPAKTTVNGWTSILERLATWYGSEYLGLMSKKDANGYKTHLLSTVSEASVATYLRKLKGWWRWGTDTGRLESNIFDGLTRKLRMETKQESVGPELIRKAMGIADADGDVGFWLQLYSGCRKGEHQGLRYCDLDMDNLTINFQEYVFNGKVRRFKGRSKDERIIPMHPVLAEKIKRFIPNCSSDATIPIWESEYNKSNETWGNNWAHRFKKNNGFVSHAIRSWVVTRLLNNNISPYILYAITRHSVPGMSAVVQGYLRPTMEDLRPVIQLIDA